MDCQVVVGVSLYARWRENSSLTGRTKYLEKMTVDNSVSYRKLSTRYRGSYTMHKTVQVSGLEPSSGDPWADYIWRLRQKDTEIQKVEYQVPTPFLRYQTRTLIPEKVPSGPLLVLGHPPFHCLLKRFQRSLLISTSRSQKTSCFLLHREISSQGSSFIGSLPAAKRSMQISLILTKKQ